MMFKRFTPRSLEDLKEPALRTSPGRRTWMSVLVLLVFALSGTAEAASVQESFRPAKGSTQTVDHSAWDRLLKTYVKKGADGLNSVDYSTFKRDGHGTLKAYIGGLQSVDPNTLDGPEQFAFFVNLYNAKTLDIVLDHYPVKSIKDVSLGSDLFASFSGGPWKAKVVKVNGVDLSLDDIEHDFLRPRFRDPRVHYAVNCASIGCPNLSTEAYTGAKLDTQLDAGARSYVNNPRGMRFEGQALIASSIYKWFKEDFGGSDQGIVKHALKYANPELGNRLRAVKSIGGFEYDWSLNDTRR